MTALAIGNGPAPASPRRFLLTASVWGGMAGLLLADAGGSVLASRWGGVTLALVHAFTLGVLGNAMVGSLLQFLPVAAGARVRGGPWAALAVYLLLNAGAVWLVLALRWPGWLAPRPGGLLVVMAFLGLAALTLPGIVRASSSRLLRWGLGCAIVAGVLTALLGFALLQVLAGRWSLPLVDVTNAHAGWGVLGWVLALLVAVARVVMPMFLGTPNVPVWLQGSWMGLLYGVLATVLAMALHGRVLPVQRGVAAVLVVAVGLAGVWLLQRARRHGRHPLGWFWRAGFALLIVAGSVLLVGGEHNLLRAGVIGLGIGLPLLVTGMQLEISAFLGWIDLHRQCGRGVHLPGVELLLPVRDKSLVLALHGLAAFMLLAALAQPAWASAGGVALLLAYAATLIAQVGVIWRARRFLKTRRRMA